MAEKEKETKKVEKVETEFQKRILGLLKEQGFRNPDASKVAIMTHNNRDEANVNYDFMSTGISFPKKEITDQEVLDAGFKLWATWHWIN